MHIVLFALLALPLTAMGPERDPAPVEPNAGDVTAPIIAVQYSPCPGGKCR
jgi:hypothetical protein